jgi:hypothetical protein
MVRDGDKLGAAASIERLAGVLRRILKVDQEHEISLADEIEFLEQYLAIEETCRLLQDSHRSLTNRCAAPWAMVTLPPWRLSIRASGFDRSTWRVVP